MLLKISLTQKLSFFELQKRNSDLIMIKKVKQT